MGDTRSSTDPTDSADVEAVDRLESRSHSASGIECPNCGYDVRGHEVRGREAGRCPECGVALDPALLSGPFLPWARRRAIGRVRAFLQTVWMVLFRNRAFRGLIDAPVAYGDAQRFRTVIILIAYLPLLLGSLVMVAAGQGGVLNFLDFEGPGGAIASNAVLHACVVLFLLAVTGVPSYFFHPSYLPVDRQNRAVALSYYTAAPLVLMLPAYVLVPAWVYANRVGLELACAVLEFLSAVCVGAAPIWWAVALRKLGNHVLGPGRAWKLTFLLIPFWILLAVLTLGVFPITVYYVAVIVHSVVT